MSDKGLTDEQIEDLNGKIDNEGFDYYFADYGCDRNLQKLCDKEIKDYLQARALLRVKLTLLGLEIN